MEPNKGKERQGEGCSFFMCKYPVMATQAFEAPEDEKSLSVFV